MPKSSIYKNDSPLFVTILMMLQISCSNT